MVNRAWERGSAMRRQLGLRGQVDAEAVARVLGLTTQRREQALDEV